VHQNSAQAIILSTGADELLASISTFCFSHFTLCFSTNIYNLTISGMETTNFSSFTYHAQCELIEMSYTAGRVCLSFTCSLNLFFLDRERGEDMTSHPRNGPKLSTLKDQTLWCWQRVVMYLSMRCSLAACN
jgi:hypothetical protein